MKTFKWATVATFAALLIPLQLSAQTFTSTFQFPASFDVALPSVSPCCTYSWAITPLQVDSSVSPGPVVVTNISVTGTAAVNGQAIGGFDWVILVGPTDFGEPASGQIYNNSNINPFSLAVSAPALFHFAEGGIGSSVINGSYNFLTGMGSTPCCAINNLKSAVSLPFAMTSGLNVQMLLFTGDPRTNLLVSNLQLTVQGQYTSANSQYLGSPGSTTNPTASFAEPVNTATGNYYSSTTDLSIRGRGESFVFNRYYNSLASYSGPLGRNWTHSYNVFITVDPNSGVATVQQQDGSRVTFTPTGSGAYTASTVGLFDELQRNADKTFLLTKRNRTKLSFSANGQLIAVTDRNGNVQRLTYDSAGDLTFIVDTVGREFDLSYDSNHHLQALCDSTGRCVSYSYDGNGNLIGATNPAGGATTYSYDSQSRLIVAVNPAGVTYVQNTYDSLGRVVSQKNGMGVTTVFSYNTPAIGTTTITDGNGNTLAHVYDANLRLIRSVDGTGATTHFSYDSNNDRTELIDANGHISTFAYDSFGNLLTATDGRHDVVSFVYDESNDLIRTTDPSGNVISFGYDNKGNLTSIVDALGNARSFAFDSYGQLQSVRNANGNVQVFTWDSSGNLVAVTDGAGRRRTLGYDAFGRITSIVDGLGHVSTVDYDVLDRVVRRADALGNRIQYTYDAMGKLVGIVDANGNRTTYKYDPLGNLSVMIDPLGHKTTYAYDANGNLTSVTNARGKTTSYLFDAANRRVKALDPLQRSTTFAYDAVGNLTAVVYANGSSKNMSYDATNEPTTLTYGDGTQVLFTYDLDGNRTSLTDSLGTTLYTHDALNRLTRVVRFDGKVVTYGYDPVGNRTSLGYPDGRVAQYAYDASNRLVSVSDGGTKATKYSYDQATRLVATRLPNGVQTTYSYDSANRLVKVVSFVRSHVISSFSYTLDRVGSRVGVASGSEAVSQYTYDALRRLTSWVDPRGRVFNYGYDEVGNRISMTTPESIVSYIYDDAEELLKAGSTTFTYDGNGNRLTRSPGAEPTFYSWDSANRLLRVQGPRESVQYQYDGLGSRVGKITNRTHVEYVYDVRHRAPQVITNYREDRQTDYIYGHAMVSAISGGDHDYLDYDGLGSVVGVSESDGSVAASFSYDPWGKSRARAEEEADEFAERVSQIPIRFAGQTFDRAANLYYLSARYYDPETGRFLSRDPIGTRIGNPLDQNTYAYARNNPVRYIDPTGLSAEGAATSSDVTSGPRIYAGIGPPIVGCLVYLGIFCGSSLTGTPAALSPDSSVLKLVNNIGQSLIKTQQTAENVDKASAIDNLSGIEGPPPPPGPPLGSSTTVGPVAEDLTGGELATGTAATGALAAVAAFAAVTFWSSEVADDTLYKYPDPVFDPSILGNEAPVTGWAGPDTFVDNTG